MAMLKRSEARNSAFVLLFECSFVTDPDRESVLALAQENHDLPVDDFVLDLFHGVLDHQKEIDQIIETHCQKRRLDRLSKMLLTALRIAVFEIRFGQTPDSVAVNEAVELIKRYDSPEAAAYGNGVLGTYVREK